MTKVEPKKEPPFPRWIFAGFVVIGLASIAGLAGLILRAVAMVRDGRGTETYRTFWLVEFNWIGVLVFLAAALAAFIIAALFRWREARAVAGARTRVWEAR